VYVEVGDVCLGVRVLRLNDCSPAPNDDGEDEEEEKA
jgi:hypothetical protein